MVGLPILVLSAIVWWLGHLPGTAVGDAHDLRLLLITLTITTVSVVALVLSFLGPASVPLR